jgi:hypothetical protein
MDGCARYGVRTPAIYNELNGLVTLLHYDSLPIGCCGIVLHPKWHRRAYPVTFFTTAPLELLQAAIAEAEAEKVLNLPAHFIESKLPTKREFETSLLLPPHERAALEGAASNGSALQ